MKRNYEHEIVKPIAGLSLQYYLCNVIQNPHHWHQEMEILACVDGALDVFSADERFSLRSGDIMVFNKNHIHRLLGSPEGNTVAVIQLDIKSFEKLVPGIGRTDFLCNSVKFPGKPYKDLLFLFCRFVEVLVTKRPGFMLELSNIRNRIVLELLRNFEHIEHSPGDDRNNLKNLSRLENILVYIDQHYNEAIGLEKIAEAVNLSPYYFSHYFHDNIGVSFRQYLAYIRVSRAMERLYSTDDRILDIAMDCGYSSSKMLSKAFKKEFGRTPGQFRDSVRCSSGDFIPMRSYHGHSRIPLSAEDVLVRMQKSDKFVIHKYDI